jgi:ArsR family metal-binding transcriptional regulator
MDLSKNYISKKDDLYITIIDANKVKPDFIKSMPIDSPIGKIVKFVGRKYQKIRYFNKNGEIIIPIVDDLFTRGNSIKEIPHADIHDACLRYQREWHTSMGGNRKKAAQNISGVAQWQHLSDAVEKGTISPMEAYEAISLGYVPENLKIRKSRYSHLI